MRGTTHKSVLSSYIVEFGGKSSLRAFEDAGGNTGPTYFQPSRRAANSSRRLLAMATYFIVLPIEAWPR